MFSNTNINIHQNSKKTTMWNDLKGTLPKGLNPNPFKDTPQLEWKRICTR
jgi:hypothetical protein